MGIDIFDKLIPVFKENGFHLYVIGGTSRDFLLKRLLTDYDFVTDATPDEMKTFLKDANYRFEMYGSVRLKVDGIKVDITTLRKENGYADHRHPNAIEFVKLPEAEYMRRDFTINAIYIDENYKIMDFCGGISDLEHKLIRFIGDPETRIKEDPLRILRAYRFKQTLGFEFEEETKKAIELLYSEVEKLNKDKVNEEIRKGLKL